MTPILCVGEGLEVREAGAHVAARARRSSTARWPASPPSRSRSIVVAYEPVWAIGTGEVATPEDAQEVCAAIRDSARRAATAATLADGVRVLYGGSVKAAQHRRRSWRRTDVDGALVGGASIDAEEFGAICRFRDHVGLTA